MLQLGLKRAGGHVSFRLWLRCFCSCDGTGSSPVALTTPVTDRNQPRAERDSLRESWSGVELTPHRPRPLLPSSSAGPGVCRPCSLDGSGTGLRKGRDSTQAWMMGQVLCDIGGEEAVSERRSDLASHRIWKT